MKDDKDPRFSITDPHISELLQDLQRRQEIHDSMADAPDLRLADDIRRAYHVEANQDRHSLERVLSRLVEDPATARSKILPLPRIDKHQERISVMQNDVTELFTPRKRGWKYRLGMFAAVLCMLLLVGSFLVIFNAIHVNRNTTTGSQGGIASTSTASPAASAITKAELTDTPGNSEGVGPGLAGIVAKSQFTVGQQFWVFFLLNESGGTVTAKWFANNQLYKSASQYIPPTPPNSHGGGIAPTPGIAQTPTPTASGSQIPSPTPTASPVESNFSITYNQAAQGKVELYWNGQLAMTLQFVVS